jgi:Uma2 family endonuclease
MTTLARIEKRAQRRSPGPYTFEDFCLLVPDGQKGDLIDGVIYVASPDNTDAGKLYTWLNTLIATFVDERDLGQVLSQRIAFRISDTYAPEPDIAFVRSNRLHLVQRRQVNGPPDLAVEIVSPDSIDRDFILKRQVYQTAGVPEYWIVDEMEEQVYLLRLDREGHYHDVRPRKGRLASRVLPGFWIEPAWLWSDPRPKLRAVLNELLGPVL